MERWNGLASETKYVHVFTYLTTHGPGLACHDTPVVHSQLKASVNLALVRWKRHPASFPLKHRVDWDTTRTEEVAIVHQNRIIESCLTHTRRNCGGYCKFDRCSANFRFLHRVVPNISVPNRLDCLYFCRLEKKG